MLKTLVKTLVKSFAEALMSVEADAVCGAEYGQRSDQRANRRNGYRAYDWDTRAGSIELAILKPRVHRMAHHHPQSGQKRPVVFRSCDDGVMLRCSVPL